jgi:flagellar biosynthesis/type III secretory pathway chaperone
MKKFFFTACFVLISTCPSLVSALPYEKVKTDPSGIFSGRISHTNVSAGLIRLKVDFDNVKYLNKKDKVEIWDEGRTERRCQAYVVGKSNDYLLLRTPNFVQCERTLTLPAGTYMRAFSQDLVNNLLMGEELIEVLLKKRLAIHGRLTREQQQLDTYIEKVNAVNSRYEILRAKLMSEWQKEIGDLQEDQSTNLRNYEGLKARLNEIDKKLEVYRIKDENLVTDRWALDPELYYEK